MCRRILLSLWTLAATLGAYWLQGQKSLLLLAERFSFLPLLALAAVSALLAFLLLLPEKGGSKLSECRASLMALALQGSGALLISGSAAWELYRLYPSLRSLAAVTAAALLLGGLGLLGGMRACMNSESKAGTLLLLPMIAAALQLLTTYWDSATDPDLTSYAPRILFLFSAACGIALVSDFVFSSGKRRLTLVLLSLTVIMSGAALATADEPTTALALAGAALSALGFFFALLFGVKRPPVPRYELVEDPFHTGRVPKAAPNVSVDSSIPPQPSSPVGDVPAKDNDHFDLSMVDRLLLELEREDEQDHRSKQ